MATWWKRHAHLLAALLVYMCAACPVIAADERVVASGGGGFPLTGAVTSMWGGVDEVVTPGKAPLSFMIYFRGREGWHDRKWESKQDWDGKPFYIEFTCDLTKLRAEVDRATRVLTIFKHEVSLNESNVLVVDQVDQPGEELVTSLGHFDLAAPEDSNPALWVLQTYDTIRSRVLVKKNE